MGLPRSGLVLTVGLIGCGPEMMEPAVSIPGDAPAPTILIVSAPAASPVGPGAAPQLVTLDRAMLGDWEGTGVQAPNLQWTFRLHLTSTEGQCAEVEYPSIPCSAYWTCEGIQDGQLRATEHLTSGQDACVDNGHLVMQLRADGKLDWRFEEAPGNVTATAELSRSAR